MMVFIYPDRIYFNPIRKGGRVFMFDDSFDDSTLIKERPLNYSDLINSKKSQKRLNNAGVFVSSDLIFSKSIAGQPLGFSPDRVEDIRRKEYHYGLFSSDHLDKQFDSQSTTSSLYSDSVLSTQLKSNPWFVWKFGVKPYLSNLKKTNITRRVMPLILPSSKKSIGFSSSKQKKFVSKFPSPFKYHWLRWREKNMGKRRGYDEVDWLMRLKYMAVRDWIKETLRTTFPISYYAPGHEFRHLQKGGVLSSDDKSTLKSIVHQEFPTRVYNHGDLRIESDIVDSLRLRERLLIHRTLRFYRFFLYLFWFIFNITPFGFFFVLLRPYLTRSFFYLKFKFILKQFLDLLLNFYNKINSTVLRFLYRTYLKIQNHYNQLTGPNGVFYWNLVLLENRFVFNFIRVIFNLSSFVLLKFENFLNVFLVFLKKYILKNVEESFDLSYELFESRYSIFRSNDLKTLLNRVVVSNKFDSEIDDDDDDTVLFDLNESYDDQDDSSILSDKIDIKRLKFINLFKNESLKGYYFYRFNQFVFILWTKFVRFLLNISRFLVINFRGLRINSFFNVFLITPVRYLDRIFRFWTFKYRFPTYFYINSLSGSSALKSVFGLTKPRILRICFYKMFYTFALILIGFKVTSVALVRTRLQRSLILLKKQYYRLDYLNENFEFVSNIQDTSVPLQFKYVTRPTPYFWKSDSPSGLGGFLQKKWYGWLLVIFTGFNFFNFTLWLTAEYMKGSPSVSRSTRLFYIDYQSNYPFTKFVSFTDPSVPKDSPIDENEEQDDAMFQTNNFLAHNLTSGNYRNQDFSYNFDFTSDTNETDDTIFPRLSYESLTRSSGDSPLRRGALNDEISSSFLFGSEGKKFFVDKEKDDDAILRNFKFQNEEMPEDSKAEEPTRSSLMEEAGVEQGVKIQRFLNTNVVDRFIFINDLRPSWRFQKYLKSPKADHSFETIYLHRLRKDRVLGTNLSRADPFGLEKYFLEGIRSPRSRLDLTSARLDFGKYLDHQQFPRGSYVSNIEEREFLNFDSMYSFSSNLIRRPNERKFRVSWDQLLKSTNHSELKPDFFFETDPELIYILDSYWEVVTEEDMAQDEDYDDVDDVITEGIQSNEFNPTQTITFFDELFNLDPLTFDLIENIYSYGNLDHSLKRNTVEDLSTYSEAETLFFWRARLTSVIDNSTDTGAAIGSSVENYGSDNAFEYKLFQYRLGLSKPDDSILYLPRTRSNWFYHNYNFWGRRPTALKHRLQFLDSYYPSIPHSFGKLKAFQFDGTPSLDSIDTLPLINFDRSFSESLTSSVYRSRIEDFYLSPFNYFEKIRTFNNINTDSRQEELSLEMDDPENELLTGSEIDQSVNKNYHFNDVVGTPLRPDNFIYPYRFVEYFDESPTALLKNPAGTFPEMVIQQIVTSAEIQFDDKNVMLPAQSLKHLDDVEDLSFESKQKIEDPLYLPDDFHYLTNFDDNVSNRRSTSELNSVVFRDNPDLILPFTDDIYRLLPDFSAVKKLSKNEYNNYSTNNSADWFSFANEDLSSEMFKDVWSVPLGQIGTDEIAHPNALRYRRNYSSSLPRYYDDFIHPPKLYRFGFKSDLNTSNLFPNFESSAKMTRFLVSDFERTQRAATDKTLILNDGLISDRNESFQRPWYFNRSLSSYYDLKESSKQGVLTYDDFFSLNQVGSSSFDRRLGLTKTNVSSWQQSLLFFITDPIVDLYGFRGLLNFFGLVNNNFSNSNKNLIDAGRDLDYIYVNLSRYHKDLNLFDYAQNFGVNIKTFWYLSSYIKPYFDLFFFNSKLVRGSARSEIIFLKNQKNIPHSFDTELNLPKYLFNFMLNKALFEPIDAWRRFALGSPTIFTPTGMDMSVGRDARTTSHPSYREAFIDNDDQADQDNFGSFFSERFQTYALPLDAITFYDQTFFSYPDLFSPIYTRFNDHYKNSSLASNSMLNYPNQWFRLQSNLYSNSFGDLPGSLQNAYFFRPVDYSTSGSVRNLLSNRISSIRLKNQTFGTTGSTLSLDFQDQLPEKTKVNQYSWLIEFKDTEPDYISDLVDFFDPNSLDDQDLDFSLRSEYEKFTLPVGISDFLPTTLNPLIKKTRLSNGFSLFLSDKDALEVRQNRLTFMFPITDNLNDWVGSRVGTFAVAKSASQKLPLLSSSPSFSSPSIQHLNKTLNDKIVLPVQFKPSILPNLSITEKSRFFGHDRFVPISLYSDSNDWLESRYLWSDEYTSDMVCYNLRPVGSGLGVSPSNTDFYISRLINDDVSINSSTDPRIFSNSLQNRLSWDMGLGWEHWESWLPNYSTVWAENWSRFKDTNQTSLTGSPIFFLGKDQFITNWWQWLSFFWFTVRKMSTHQDLELYFHEKPLAELDLPIPNNVGKLFYLYFNFTDPIFPINNVSDKKFRELFRSVYNDTSDLFGNFSNHFIPLVNLQTTSKRIGWPESKPFHRDLCSVDYKKYKQIFTYPSVWKRRSWLRTENILDLVDYYNTRLLNFDKEGSLVNPYIRSFCSFGPGWYSFSNKLSNTGYYSYLNELTNLSNTTFSPEILELPSGFRRKLIRTSLNSKSTVRDTRLSIFNPIQSYRPTSNFYNNFGSGLSQSLIEYRYNSSIARFKRLNTLHDNSMLVSNDTILSSSIKTDEYPIGVFGLGDGVFTEDYWLEYIETIGFEESDFFDDADSYLDPRPYMLFSAYADLSELKEEDRYLFNNDYVPGFLRTFYDFNTRYLPVNKFIEEQGDVDSSLSFDYIWAHMFDFFNSKSRAIFGVTSLQSSGAVLAQLIGLWTYHFIEMCTNPFLFIFEFPESLVSWPVFNYYIGWYVLFLLYSLYVLVICLIGLNPFLAASPLFLSLLFVVLAMFYLFFMGLVKIISPNFHRFIRIIGFNVTYIFFCLIVFWCAVKLISIYVIICYLRLNGVYASLVLYVVFFISWVVVMAYSLLKLSETAQRYHRTLKAIAQSRLFVPDIITQPISGSDFTGAIRYLSDYVLNISDRSLNDFLEPASFIDYGFGDDGNELGMMEWGSLTSVERYLNVGGKDWFKKKSLRSEMLDHRFSWPRFFKTNNNRSTIREFSVRYRSSLVNSKMESKGIRPYNTVPIISAFYLNPRLGLGLDRFERLQDFNWTNDTLDQRYSAFVDDFFSEPTSDSSSFDEAPVKRNMLSYRPLNNKIRSSIGQFGSWLREYRTAEELRNNKAREANSSDIKTSTFSEILSSYQNSLDLKFQNSSTPFLKRVFSNISNRSANQINFETRGHRLNHLSHLIYTNRFSSKGLNALNSKRLRQNIKRIIKNYTDIPEDLLHNLWLQDRPKFLPLQHRYLDLISYSAWVTEYWSDTLDEHRSAYGSNELSYQLELSFLVAHDDDSNTEELFLIALTRYINIFFLYVYRLRLWLEDKAHLSLIGRTTLFFLICGLLNSMVQTYEDSPEFIRRSSHFGKTNWSWLSGFDHFFLEIFDYCGRFGVLVFDFFSNVVFALAYELVRLFVNYSINFNHRWYYFVDQSLLIYSLLKKLNPFNFFKQTILKSKIDSFERFFIKNYTNTIYGQELIHNYKNIKPFHDQVWLYSNFKNFEFGDFSYYGSRSVFRTWPVEQMWLVSPFELIRSWLFNSLSFYIFNLFDNFNTFVNKIYVRFRIITSGAFDFRFFGNSSHFAVDKLVYSSAKNWTHTRDRFYQNQLLFANLNNSNKTFYDFIFNCVNVQPSKFSIYRDYLLNLFFCRDYNYPTIFPFYKFSNPELGLFESTKFIQRLLRTSNRSGWLYDTSWFRGTRDWVPNLPESSLSYTLTRGFYNSLQDQLFISDRYQSRSSELPVNPKLASIVELYRQKPTELIAIEGLHSLFNIKTGIIYHSIRPENVWNIFNGVLPYRLYWNFDFNRYRLIPMTPYCYYEKDLNIDYSLLKTGVNVMRDKVGLVRILNDFDFNFFGVANLLDSLFDLNMDNGYWFSNYLTNKWDPLIQPIPHTGQKSSWLPYSTLDYTFQNKTPGFENFWSLHPEMLIQNRLRFAKYNTSLVGSVLSKFIDKYVIDSRNVEFLKPFSSSTSSLGDQTNRNFVGPFSINNFNIMNNFDLFLKNLNDNLETAGPEQFSKKIDDFKLKSSIFFNDIPPVASLIDKFKILNSSSFYWYNYLYRGKVGTVGADLKNHFIFDKGYPMHTSLHQGILTFYLYGLNELFAGRRLTDDYWLVADSIEPIISIKRTNFNRSDSASHFSDILRGYNSVSYQLDHNLKSDILYQLNHYYKYYFNSTQSELADEGTEFDFVDLLNTPTSVGPELSEYARYFSNSIASPLNKDVLNSTGYNSSFNPRGLNFNSYKLIIPIDYSNLTKTISRLFQPSYFLDSLRDQDNLHFYKRLNLPNNSIFLYLNPNTFIREEFNHLADFNNQPLRLYLNQNNLVSRKGFYYFWTNHCVPHIFNLKTPFFNQILGQSGVSPWSKHRPFLESFPDNLINDLPVYYNFYVKHLGLFPSLVFDQLNVLNESLKKQASLVYKLARYFIMDSSFSPNSFDSTYYSFFPSYSVKNVMYGSFYQTQPKNPYFQTRNPMDQEFTNQFISGPLILYSYIPPTENLYNSMSFNQTNHSFYDSLTLKAYTKADLKFEKLKDPALEKSHDFSNSFKLANNPLNPLLDESTFKKSDSWSHFDLFKTPDVDRIVKHPDNSLYYYPVEITLGNIGKTSVSLNSSDRTDSFLHDELDVSSLPFNFFETLEEKNEPDFFSSEQENNIDFYNVPLNDPIFGAERLIGARSDYSPLSFSKKHTTLRHSESLLNRLVALPVYDDYLSKVSLGFERIVVEPAGSLYYNSYTNKSWLQNNKPNTGFCRSFNNKTFGFKKPIEFISDPIPTLPFNVIISKFDPLSLKTTLLNSKINKFSNLFKHTKSRVLNRANSVNNQIKSEFDLDYGLVVFLDSFYQLNMEFYRNFGITHSLPGFNFSTPTPTNYLSLLNSSELTNHSTVFVTTFSGLINNSFVFVNDTFADPVSFFTNQLKLFWLNCVTTKDLKNLDLSDSLISDLLIKQINTSNPYFFEQNLLSFINEFLLLIIISIISMFYLLIIVPHVMICLRFTISLIKILIKLIVSFLFLVIPISLLYLLLSGWFISWLIITILLALLTIVFLTEYHYAVLQQKLVHDSITLCDPVNPELESDLDFDLEEWSDDLAYRGDLVINPIHVGSRNLIENIYGDSYDAMNVFYDDVNSYEQEWYLNELTYYTYFIESGYRTDLLTGQLSTSDFRHYLEVGGWVDLRYLEYNHVNQFIFDFVKTRYFDYKNLDRFLFHNSSVDGLRGSDNLRFNAFFTDLQEVEQLNSNESEEGSLAVTSLDELVYDFAQIFNLNWDTQTAREIERHTIESAKSGMTSEEFERFTSCSDIDSVLEAFSSTAVDLVPSQQQPIIVELSKVQEDDELAVSPSILSHRLELTSIEFFDSLQLNDEYFWSNFWHHSCGTKMREWYRSQPGFSFRDLNQKKTFDTSSTPLSLNKVQHFDDSKLRTDVGIFRTDNFVAALGSEQWMFLEKDIITALKRLVYKWFEIWSALGWKRFLIFIIKKYNITEINFLLSEFTLRRLFKEWFTTQPVCVLVNELLNILNNQSNKSFDFLSPKIYSPILNNVLLNRLSFSQSSCYSIPVDFNIPVFSSNVSGDTKFDEFLLYSRGRLVRQWYDKFNRTGGMLRYAFSVNNNFSRFGDSRYVGLNYLSPEHRILESGNSFEIEEFSLATNNKSASYPGPLSYTFYTNRPEDEPRYHYWKWLKWRHPSKDVPYIQSFVGYNSLDEVIIKDSSILDKVKLLIILRNILADRFGTQYFLSDNSTRLITNFTRFAVILEKLFVWNRPFLIRYISPSQIYNNESDFDSDRRESRERWLLGSRPNTELDHIIAIEEEDEDRLMQSDGVLGSNQLYLFDDPTTQSISASERTDELIGNYGGNPVLDLLPNFLRIDKERAISLDYDIDKRKLTRVDYDDQSVADYPSIDDPNIDDDPIQHLDLGYTIFGTQQPWPVRVPLIDSWSRSFVGQVFSKSTMFLKSPARANDFKDIFTKLSKFTIPLITDYEHYLAHTDKYGLKQDWKTFQLGQGYVIKIPANKLKVSVSKHTSRYNFRKYADRFVRFKYNFEKFFKHRLLVNFERNFGLKDWARMKLLDQTIPQFFSDMYSFLRTDYKLSLQTLIHISIDTPRLSNLFTFKDTNDLLDQINNATLEVKQLNALDKFNDQFLGYFDQRFSDLWRFNGFLLESWRAMFVISDLNFVKLLSNDLITLSKSFLPKPPLRTNLMLTQIQKHVNILIPPAHSRFTSMKYFTSRPIKYAYSKSNIFLNPWSVSDDAIGRPINKNLNLIRKTRSYKSIFLRKKLNYLKLLNEK